MRYDNKGGGLKVKQLNIQIEDHQHEWLRQKAFAERLSMAQVVREIINKSMKEESEKDENIQI